MCWWSRKYIWTAQVELPDGSLFRKSGYRKPDEPDFYKFKWKHCTVNHCQIHTAYIPLTYRKVKR